MRVNAYLTATGVLFALVMGLHAIRLLYELPVTIGAFRIPLAWSWLGVALAGGLCVWAIVLVRQRS